jgi:tetratricopeptide (TPR) repeat protein
VVKVGFIAVNRKERVLSLGSRLKKIRTERGMTQKELAAPSYTHAYISTIEAGRRTPSRDALAHFAAKLGVGVDELMTGRPPDLIPQLQLRLSEARRLVSAGDFEEADANYARTEREAHRYGLVRLEAKAREGRGLAAERSGNLEVAIEHYETAEELLDPESPVARADVVSAKARCLQMLGETRYAAYALESLLEMLERRDLRDPTALVRLHASLVAAYFELGLYKKASASADKALSMAAKVEDPEGLAAMHINAARVLLHDGRSQDAEDSLRRAEELYKQLDLQSETGSAYLAQGYIMAREDRVGEARDKLRLAIEHFERHPNPVDEATAINELARLERLDGKERVALELLDRSIKLLRDSDVAELGLAYRERGLCLARSDATLAEKSFRTAIELYERSEETVQLPATYRALGDLLSDGGDRDGGCEAYRTGILVLEEALEGRAA